MTVLKRPVWRETAATVYERGKYRPVLVCLSAPDLVGCRLKGTRRVYWLPADCVFGLALKADLAARAREADKNKNENKRRRRRRSTVKRGALVF